MCNLDFSNCTFRLLKGASFKFILLEQSKNLIFDWQFMGLLEKDSIYKNSRDL